MKRIEFHCAHCGTVTGTATGEWDEGALGKTVTMCTACLGCAREMGDSKLRTFEEELLARWAAREGDA